MAFVVVPGREIPLHLITVGKLREILEDPGLSEDDQLMPNDVHNLAVYRGGIEFDNMLGFIDCGQTEAIEWTN